MAFYFLVFFLAVLSFIHFYLHYGRMGRVVNKFKGPPIVPVLGNLLNLHVSLVRLNELLREWGNTYYPIYRLWIGHRATVHIRHPDDLEIVLTSAKHIEKELGYVQLHLWLKSGLLIGNGQKWRQRRKILTPAFHFNVLRKYMEITNEQGDKAVKNTKVLGKEIKVDLLPFCSQYTLNIICESAMGVPLDDEADKESGAKYKDGVYRMCHLVIYRLIRPYILDWMIPYIPKINKEYEEVIGNLNYFTNKIIKERREYHEGNNYKELKNIEEEDDNKNIDSSGTKRRLAMLDLLLAAEKEKMIDDEGIKEEVDTFVFAGHDTTAMGMCFTLLLFAENKEAQDLAREEVERIYSRNNGKLDNSDLQEMNYLERCIKESLRLFPSVPTIGRQLKDDIQLKNCLVPKGATIIMHIIDVHRDPSFWPEPDKFDPDRFLPNNVQGRNSFCYLPFSAGPRNCIGQKFAMMELKSLLSKILYNFYLEPINYTKDIKITSDVVTRPSEPVYTKFIRIDRPQ